MVKIFAVLVLYKLRPRQSLSLRTLIDAARTCDPAELNLQVLIRDNTPGGGDSKGVPAAMSYEAAPDNPGLSSSYNRAIQIATEGHYEWLLTLDQDTELPPDYLKRIAEHCRSLKSHLDIGAIAPQVTEGARMLSPFLFAGGVLPRCFTRGFIGTNDSATYAVNSAAVLRIATLHDIGGYNEMFPLDMSDLNMFHRLHQSGRKVFIAGDIQISHEYSLFNKHERMSVERYKSMLIDECGFWDMSMGRLARFERIVRLMGRALRDSFNADEHAFRAVTVLELRRRLSTRRSCRIAGWIEFATARARSGSQLN